MADRIGSKMARRAVAMMCAVLDVPYSNGYDEAGWAVTSVGLGRYAIASHDGVNSSEGRPVDYHNYSSRELYDLAHFTINAVQAAQGQEGTYPKIRNAMQRFDELEAESERAHRRWQRKAARHNAKVSAVLDAQSILRAAR